MDTNQVINQLVTNIMLGNSSEAQDNFIDVINNKINDALEISKQNIASSMYNTDSQEESNDQAA